MKSLQQSLFCLGFVVLHSFCLAQTTVKTDPVGFMTVPIAGTGGTTAKALTFLGLGLAQAVSFQGQITATGSASITSTGAGWVDNQFNSASTPCYVELLSGSYAGITSDIVSTTAATQTITTADNLTPFLKVGDTIRIRPNWTIASLFGANNSSGLQGGNSSTADQVWLWNGAGFTFYYYKSTGVVGGTGWRSLSSASIDTSNTRIEPDQGLIIARAQSSGTAITLNGTVKTGQSSIPVYSGLSLVGNIYPVDTTLSQCLIYTGTASNGLNGGTSSTADQVWIWNGTGFNQYYYKNSGVVGGTGWRSFSSASQDASSTPIPAGTSIFIQRRGSSFNWVTPQNPVNFN